MISKIQRSRHFEPFTTAQGSRTFSNVGKIRDARGVDVSIERRRRDTETVCDLGDADVWVGQQCPRGFKVVLCQLWRTAPRSACAPSSGKAGLGALSDQAALEFRNAPNM
jgi:hypothetical protein